VCSSILWIAARWSRISVGMLIDIALAVEFVLALQISLYAAWYVYVSSGGRVLPYITWVEVIVILFPLMLPMPPRRALLGAILAGSTRPGAVIALDAFGAIAVGSDQVVLSFVSPTIAVLISFVCARMVYGLGIEVERARRMGSYHLVARLGLGGMGEVWRARHRMLARPAAIKLIRNEAPDGTPMDRSGSVRARFEQEAQATASLRSPHTVELYDFGVTDDGTFYYVMELLDGYDLNRLVKEFGPVPPERAIHFLRQLTHSLGEAHDRGLVHRDIKPANLVTCRYGSDVDFLKVLDFGLVKAKNRIERGDPELTVGEIAGGTPGFMAPEQFLGNRPPDGRTDLYAAGCVGYWLLTGRMVFEGETPMDIMVQHAKTPPVPPSERTEQDVPPDLEAVLLSCLEKEPERRPADAAELRRRLEACAAAGAWTEERARRWWEAHAPAAVDG